jgi:heme exporter protein A
LLRFDDVTLQRGGKVLFQHLSFELPGGEALHIAGPNGSGKSSLIRLAAGLLQSNKGEVHRSSTALSDANMALDRELPLGRALRFWVPSPDEAMETLGLRDLGQVPVRFLSSGQLKRATLARVAASDARLWLLDEPLNGLDSQSADWLATMISRHLASGGAVVAASHVPLPGTWQRVELGQ